MTNNGQNNKNIHFEAEYRLDRVFNFNPKFISVGLQKGAERGYDYLSHIQDEYEFIYILSGDITYYCDDTKMHVDAGDMYFIQPHQRHREVSNRPDVAFVYLKFFLYDYRGDRADRLTEDISRQVFRSVPDSVKHVFLRVFDEMQSHDWGFKQIIEAAMTELLIFVQRQYRNFEERPPAQCASVGAAVSAILDEITLNVGAQYTVGDLAKRYGMSESSLAHAFKQITGKSLIHFINERRIQEAQNQLSSTGNTLKYIAKILGFSTVSYFKRVFKQYTGYPPDEYRKRVLGIYQEKGDNKQTP